MITYVRMLIDALFENQYDPWFPTRTTNVLKTTRNQSIIKYLSKHTLLLL
jgi:hypothetical protein